MLFDFSNVGQSAADAIKPPAFKVAGSANAEFGRELTATLGRSDPDVRAEVSAHADAARQTARDAREAHEAARDAHKAAREAHEAARDERATARADHDAEADAETEVKADDGRVSDDAPTEEVTQHPGQDGEPKPAETTAPVDALVGADVAVEADKPPPDVVTQSAATTSEQSPAAESKAVPATQPTTTAVQTAKTAAAQAVQSADTTATDNTTTQTAAAKKTEAASTPAQPVVTDADQPQSEQALLAALESILGPQAKALLDTGAQSAGDELPSVLNVAEGFAAQGGQPALIAHMLQKRIDALQQRLDRLQQLLKAQPPGSGATLDPSVAAKLGFADNTTVNDVITNMIRQTEARLDALMNGNARAAAQPAALTADGARAGGATTGSFASHLSGDATAATGSSSTSQTAAAQHAATLAARAAPPQTAAGIQVAIHLARAVQDGLDRINIRLNPAELGRVDVKLEVGHDGRAIAVVTADRQDTLDLLQRDARGLERALQDAGLRADSGSLSFNLRQHGQGSGQMAGGSSSAGGGAVTGPAEDDVVIAATAQSVDPNRLLDISV